MTALMWTVLALVPPLIFALYFLKLRRQPLEVPSTYLWKKTIEDLHVNSLWQRLRNSLLLLLQLLLALLLILACINPGCEGETLSGDRLIFLIDNSASMSATDVEGSDSRLDDAKKQIGNLIDRMDEGAVGMLISFSDSAVPVQSYTTNHSILKSRLNEIEQTQHSTDINEALVAASGLANPGRTSDRESAVDIQVADALEATIFIYSDGGVREVPAFSFGEKLFAEYHPVGGAEIPDNVGITAFSISDQADSDTQVQAYARIQNSSDEDQSVDLSLYVDDQLLDARAAVTIRKESSIGLQFDLTGVVDNMSGPVPVRLEIENDDVYKQDNSGYAVLNPPRLPNVLVITDYNRYLEMVCNDELGRFDFQPESFIEDDRYLKDAQLGTWDLIIYDRCVPETMPVANTVFIGAIPPVEGWSAEEKRAPTSILDINAGHPVMSAVQMGNVDILDSQPLAGPEGADSLMDSVDGTIIMIAPRGGFQDLVLGFSLIEIDPSGSPVSNTNWPIRLSFPLFFQNVVTELGGSSAFAASRGASPGTLVRLKSKVPYDSVTVTGPDGTNTSLKPGDDSTFMFAQTEQCGIYTVREPGGTVDHLFPVNLFDRRESDLKVRDTLDLGYEEMESSESQMKPVTKDFWPWFVGFALVVLVIEWYIYNKRVFI
ncbi:MAG: BatA and WFA domain-containing protein [Planctomycetota bacterium]